ncbi:hypothetical protein MKY20_11400 [Cytobacillus sp. FSL W8-0315]|uniref:hypothetical protein n=1 Tax=Cytobacillus sp. FSL W8-0315 TaxID=2921600 RepID=UPI0030F5A005
MSNICEEHGVLKRSCHICELEEENKELKSLSLWAIRRVHRSQKEFGYDEYKKITGEEPERL